MPGSRSAGIRARSRASGREERDITPPPVEGENRGNSFYTHALRHGQWGGRADRPVPAYIGVAWEPVKQGRAEWGAEPSRSAGNPVAATALQGFNSGL